MIDTHVNLHDPAFDDDREATIARARAAGVERMINVCDRLANFEAVRAIADREAIWCTAGVHPHHALENADLSIRSLCATASDPKVVALGECGLDYHYDRSPREVQRRVFAVHIAAARATGLPLVVHTREADEDMLAMLEAAWPWTGFRVLLHCYTSGAVLAARAAELGAWFSVSGIATFRAAADVRDRITAMPADRIVCETDCPYLAPTPLRGRRNEPAFLPHVVAKLAEIRGWSLPETQRRTDAAAAALFDRLPPQDAPAS